ncbi:MAG: methyltransferase domain-containing protein [Chloroflexi bacterium]|nr:methyltransferase domain-containing protein [Chloroflexota bacterium]
MKRSTLDLLACPACGSALTLEGEGNPVDAGLLRCQGCGREFLIREGIPQFLPPEGLTGLNRRFAHLYDWFSYVYDLYARIAFAFLGGESRRRRELLSHLESDGSGRLLEVSIGTGGNLPYMIGKPGLGEIYGLDISLGQLRRCQSRCRRKGWEVDLFLGNAEQLPFKDEVFDSVFHFGGINFFNDRKKAIAEMIRVARPGTKIVISDEHERGARSYELTLPGFSRTFKRKREPVRPPVELVPETMEDIRLTDIWRGWFYCLEFRKRR